MIVKGVKVQLTNIDYSNSSNREITIKKFDIDPKYIEIELTEITNIEDISKMEKFIKTLQENNISVSMDDFGSGYSSITLLKNLNYDIVKIDKGIIDSMHIRQEDLASKLGKSRSHVTNIIGLLRLPDNVQNMILDNRLSMGHARVLSKIEDDSKISELAMKVVNDNLSVRDLERLSTDVEIKKKVPTQRASHSNDYSYLENELRDFLGTKVKISNKKMEIYFENSNDLQRILEILDVKIN